MCFLNYSVWDGVAMEKYCWDIGGCRSKEWTRDILSINFLLFSPPRTETIVTFILLCTSF